MNKRVSLGLCAALLAAVLAGCGSSSDVANSTAAYSGSAGYSSEAYGYDMARSADVAEAAPELSPQASSRKIVYTATLTVETKTYDDSRTALRTAAEEMGGYLESSSEYGSAENGDRSAWFTFRIPADRYRTFLDSVGSLGSVVSRSENTEDITASYVDVQARLESLESQRARLEVLREQAESLEDLLTIESQLSDVQYQLESYTAQKNLYDDQVDYCTVTVDLDEVAAYTPANTFGSRISAAFGASWSSFVSTLQELLIRLIYLLPYLLILVLVLLVLLLLRRRFPPKAKTRTGPQTPRRGGTPNYAALYHSPEQPEPPAEQTPPEP